MGFECQGGRGSLTLPSTPSIRTLLPSICTTVRWYNTCINSSYWMLELCFIARLVFCSLLKCYEGPDITVSYIYYNQVQNHFVSKYCDTKLYPWSAPSVFSMRFIAWSDTPCLKKIIVYSIFGGFHESPMKTWNKMCVFWWLSDPFATLSGQNGGLEIFLSRNLFMGIQRISE